MASELDSTLEAFDIKWLLHFIGDEEDWRLCGGGLLCHMGVASAAEILMLLCRSGQRAIVCEIYDKLEELDATHGTAVWLQFVWLYHKGCSARACYNGGGADNGSGCPVRQ